MSDFKLRITNVNLLDKDRSKKIEFAIRGAKFTCDLPRSYNDPVEVDFLTAAQGGWGTGMDWRSKVGNYDEGEVVVKVTSVYGTFTGTNKSASGSSFTKMCVLIDKGNSPAVAVTFE